MKNCITKISNFARCTPVHCTNLYQTWITSFITPVIIIYDTSNSKFITPVIRGQVYRRIVVFDQTGYPQFLKILVRLVLTKRPRGPIILLWIECFNSLRNGRPAERNPRLNPVELES